MSSKSKLLGYQFHPTDEELINHLRNFVLHEILPPTGAIKVADLYGDTDPWQIIATSREKIHYFFSRLKRFKNSIKKFARTAGKGTWKGQTSGDPIIGGSNKNITIGYKRSLRCESDIEKDESGKWLMKEYILPDELIKRFSDEDHIFVLCRIKEKKKNKKNNEGVTNEVMKEDVDEVVGYILGSNCDNHQVITNDDDN